VVISRRRAARVLAYPAEAPTFDGVDQTCAAAIFETRARCRVLLRCFHASVQNCRLLSESRLELSRPELERLGYAVPLDLAADEVRFILRLSPLPRSMTFAATNRMRSGSARVGRDWLPAVHRRYGHGAVCEGACGVALCGAQFIHRVCKRCESRPARLHCLRAAHLGATFRVARRCAG